MTSTKEAAALVKAVAVVVREYISLAIADVQARVKALEDRPAPRDGKDGERGADGLKGADGAQGLRGSDGAEGKPGPTGERGERGEHGEPGLSGKDGERGIQGERGVDGQEGPAGLQGLPGPTGEPGRPGPQGERGHEGPAGPARDGRDGLPGVPGAQGEKGIDGANGVHGKDGADGLGFDDMSVLPDGERSVTFRFVKGDRVKDFTVTFPVEIYRGVYLEGKTYDRCDGVTWGGSEWHCNETTTTKPGEGSKAWTLKVKRGRDGRDGVDAPGALPVVKVR